MLMHESVERTKAYLDAHLGQRMPDSAHYVSSTGPYVTISRESGSGGTSFAQLLARRLNKDHPNGPPWTVYDQDIVERMLRNQHLSPDLAQYLPEGKVWEVDALVREIVGLHPNLWHLVRQTNRLIQEMARNGRAIFVGRGSSFATSTIPHGLHIRLVAPPAIRAATTAARLKIPVDEAAGQHRRVDAARAAYVRSVFQADVADPAAYDIVINTGHVALATAVDLAVTLVPVPAEAR